MTDWLRENLEKGLALPAPATEWLVMLFNATQVFDDVADGDPVNREDLNATIWNTLVGMTRIKLNELVVLMPSHLCGELGFMMWC